MKVIDFLKLCKEINICVKWFVETEYDFVSEHIAWTRKMLKIDFRKTWLEDIFNYEIVFISQEQGTICLYAKPSKGDNK